MNHNRYSNGFVILLIAVGCMITHTPSAYGQKISNYSVIQTDLDKYENSFSTQYLNYEESENYNYLGLQYGNLPLYQNEDLISEGGDPFTDNQFNYYYVLKMDKSNQYVDYTNIYLKEVNGDFNWNMAGFDSKMGMTTKDDYVYVYGTTQFTDSLFIKNEFIILSHHSHFLKDLIQMCFIIQMLIGYTNKPSARFQ